MHYLSVLWLQSDAKLRIIGGTDEEDERKALARKILTFKLLLASVSVSIQIAQITQI